MSKKNIVFGSLIFLRFLKQKSEYRIKKSRISMTPEQVLLIPTEKSLINRLMLVPSMIMLVCGRKSLRAWKTRIVVMEEKILQFAKR